MSADAKIAATPLCDLIDIREGKEEWRNAVESALRQRAGSDDPARSPPIIDAVKVQRRSTRSDGVESSNHRF